MKKKIIKFIKTPQTNTPKNQKVSSSGELWLMLRAQKLLKRFYKGGGTGTSDHKRVSLPLMSRDLL